MRALAPLQLALPVPGALEHVDVGRQVHVVRLPALEREQQVVAFRERVVHQR